MASAVAWGAALGAIILATAILIGYVLFRPDQARLVRVRVHGIPDDTIEDGTVSREVQLSAVPAAGDWIAVGPEEIKVGAVVWDVDNPNAVDVHLSSRDADKALR